jgi:hypothetical protein
LSALLPVLSAALGFAGGLFAVSLGERKRRESALVDRRRAATINLVHELFAIIEMDTSVPVIYNRMVVRCTEAAHVLELEYEGKEASQLYRWFDTASTPIFKSSNPSTADEASRLAADLVDMTRRLMLLYRGAIGTSQLGMPKEALPD